jgi:hypothetical protein
MIYPLRLKEILCSAYMLGGSVEHLRAVYNDETSQLERWPVQSFVISDVKEHLGKLEYIIPVAQNGSLKRYQLIRSAYSATNMLTSSISKKNSSRGKEIGRD